MYVMNNIIGQYDINMLNIRIKELRTLRGFTQQTLADEIGVKRQAIINWERKKNTIPSVENLIDLCYALDCSMDYLLGSVDTPEIEPISKASHYSGISADIIRYGIEHSDFLECINFFMHPKNSASIFNSITLIAEKKSWMELSINEIKGELKERIFLICNEYILSTPPDEISKKTYKSFLEQKLPREKITLKADRTNSKLFIKQCISQEEYQKFFLDKQFDYASFINYLVEHTFNSLSYITMLEIQEYKLAKDFVNLINKFLDTE